MEFYNYHGFQGQVLEFDPKEVIQIKDSDGRDFMQFERQSPPPPAPEPEPDDNVFISSSRREAEKALLSDFQKYQKGGNI